MSEHGVGGNAWLTRLEQDDPAMAGGIDTSTASVARVYDYLLGGKDNFEVDRDAAATFQHSEIGDVMELSLDNRDYLMRVVRFLAERKGIDQFIDLGSGLPTRENVHQVAQRADPDARVVYVDDDPAVLAHGKALLADNDRIRVIQADMSAPGRVLSDPAVTGLIDFTRPVAVLFISVLHCVPDDADPRGAVAAMLDAVPSGSYLALSHAVCGDPAASARATKVITEQFGEFGRIRTPDEARGFFGGLNVVEPGLLDVRAWRNPAAPDESVLAPSAGLFEFGGVARKP